MQKPVILTSWQDPGLAQLEAVLQRWFFDVRQFSRPEQLLAALSKGGGDLLILDGRMAERLSAALGGSESADSPLADCPVLLLRDDRPHAPLAFAHQTLPLPLDLTQLHEQMQKILQSCPRRHLRMQVQLPGVIFRRQGCSFGDILSLGTGGAFIKTGCKDIRKGEPIEVVVPLMGMKKELELSSEVVYQVSPTPENNYQQGVGVRFTAPVPEDIQTLRDYITRSLLEEIHPDEGREPSYAVVLVDPGAPPLERQKVSPPRLFLHP